MVGGLVASSTLEAFHEAFNSLMYESAAAHMQIHKVCKRAKGYPAPPAASSCLPLSLFITHTVM